MTPREVAVVREMRDLECARIDKDIFFDDVCNPQIRFHPLAIEHNRSYGSQMRQGKAASPNIDFWKRIMSVHEREQEASQCAKKLPRRR